MDLDFNIRRRTARLEVAPVPVTEDNQNDTLQTNINSFSDIRGSSRLPMYGMDDNDSNSTAGRSVSPLDEPSSSRVDDDIETIDEDAPSGTSSGDGDNNDSQDNQNSDDPAPKRRPFGWLIDTIKAHPRWSVAIGAVLLILLVGGGVYAYKGLHPKPVANSPVAKAKKKAAAPAVITSPLTGLPVSEEQSKRVVTGAMIENTVFARPQSGLKEAGVVFEAIAEAGITRFLALFQDNQAPNIGPIRSARPYYVDWAHSFDAPLAHVGGSPDALSKIKSNGVKDLDQFFNSGAYHRVGSREAPHNVYTSIASLNNVEKSKGWTSSSFTGFERKKEAPAKVPTAKTIDLAISGPTYNAHYDYDAANNQYLRSEGGAPHKDAESGAQLAPKVVIALVAPYSLMSDGYHSQYQITGSGEMTVFQDGTVTKGTWARKDGPSQYTFTDAEGHALKLNPGQTWITVVGTAGAVTYKP